VYNLGLKTFGIIKVKVNGVKNEKELMEKFERLCLTNVRKADIEIIDCYMIYRGE
jgi:hypothetical protein